MITWIITSILLSISGSIIYLFTFRLIPSPHHRKVLLYVILGLSLGLPFIIQAKADSRTFKTNPFASTEISSIAYIPQTVEEYCHCQEPGKGELMMFKASRLYDLLLQNSLFLMLIPGIFSLFLLLRITLRFRALRILAQSSEIDKLEVGNRSVHILTVLSNIPAASFRLLRSYVIWHPNLNRLSSGERKAVIHHEVSHLDQFNTWEELFLQVIQTVWFINPAFYLIRHEFRKLSEFIADDAALTTGIEPRSYALLLLKLKSGSLPLGSQGFSTSLLKQRIERLGKLPNKRSPWILPLLILTFFSLSGVNLYSNTIISDQIQDFEIYDYLSKNNRETGKTAFCKSCTYENVFGNESN